MTSSRGARGPASVYGSLASALVVLMATVALTTASPPPPAIAEFAPEAVQQISNAPDEQQQVDSEGRPIPSASGSPSSGASASSSATAQSPGASPSLPVHRVARAHTCVGSPPRQTEDPQSPPCVAYYEGKLLGATSRGVTANEIRVVVPCDPGSEGGWGCGQDAAIDLKAFQVFFNERFELYGRKLKIIRHIIKRPPTVDNLVADAQAIATLEPFAVLDYPKYANSPDPTGTTAVFFRELARRRIVNLLGLQLENGMPNITQPELQTHAPYSWTYLPTTDMVLTQLGDLICSSLVGRAPYFDIDANPVVAQPAKRRFGIAVPRVPQSSANLDESPLLARLKSCGAPFQVQAYEPRNDGSNSAAGLESAIAKFHADGVTTVVMLASGWIMNAMHQHAAAAQYYPEWMTSNIYGADAMTWATVSTGIATERQRMFGLRSENKPVFLGKNYFYQAVKEYDPNYTGASRRGFYQAMLLLASGIQMAGPNLTPETFQQALYDTSFPGNGTAGGPPEWHAAVDFGPGDHTMQGDFGFQFVNQDEINNDFPQLKGTYCSVERGVRFGPGELRRPLRFFNAGVGMGSTPCL